MSASTAAVVGGGSTSGEKVSLSDLMKKVKNRRNPETEAVGPEEASMQIRGNAQPDASGMHGDEMHTGGGGGTGSASAVGGGGGSDIFNVGDAISGMEGMDRKGQREYMGQFDNKQRSRIKFQQMSDRRKSLGGMFGASNFSPFMMKAKGHNKSPIEKNYGSPAQRGFHAPNKMKSFGVGDSNKEKMGGVGSNMLDK